MGPIQVWADDGNQWDELKSWVELPKGYIPVIIVKDAKIHDEKVDIMEDAINSKHTKNSRTEFLGWNEGIKEISKLTEKKIPTLHVEYTLKNKESITIYLMEQISPEGYDGFTHLFYDQNGKINKAFIKIYNADELNNRQLESIIRHELGHALGLGHTNVKNDLMNPIINTYFNSISFLDLTALLHIY